MTVFSQAYFTLALEIHRAKSFDRLTELLTEGLPKVISGKGGLIFVTFDGHGVEQIYGETSFAKEAKANLDAINESFSCFPLVSKVDLSNPGELGFSVRDYLHSEDFLGSKFFQIVQGQEGVQDYLFGLLAHGYERTTMLIVGRSDGVFSPEERGIFDSLLLAARSVASLIAVEGDRRQIRNFYVKNSPRSRQALFVVKQGGEVLPFNHDALRAAEDWWGEDDAFFALPADKVEKLNKELLNCWVGPLSSSFRKFEIDLGGGTMDFSCMPAWDGEIWLVLSLVDREAAATEALNALLTKRQREIMNWISQGKTSAETATILDISPRTVEKHLEAIFQRLGVENRIAAVRNYLDIKSGQLV
ncbi:response regulator transcription factor [Haloferula chungangensis]|uniref:Response regulator transcription factor n=1 Tax=Haloferula chungangensis TaxID=1048331 RepID=A0ABW2L969_9BACT